MRKLKKRHKKPIHITASEVATDSLGLCDRKSFTPHHNGAGFTSLSSVVQAGEAAYKKTGLGPADIDVAELHDCFSIAEVVATEDLGFSRRGEGASDIAAGKFTLPAPHSSKSDVGGKGKIITNSSGGLKACGHPVGATGVKQIVEIVEQLRHEAGKRQVSDAKIGLAHNVGGSGTIAVIHILQK